MKTFTSLWIAALLSPSATLTPETPETETWRAWLVLVEEETGAEAELPFGLELARTSGAWQAFLLNGEERIDVPRVEYDGRRLLLEMPHYDSRIRAELDEGRGLLIGEWEKVRGAERVARLPFRARLHARDGSLERFPAGADDGPPWNVHGRWSVDFESDELGAIGLFEQADDDTRVTGTFLTATGDYRYLEGRMSGSRLRLSCFDGAHAFLFDARLGSGGELSGVFHSGNWWKETWTARRDFEAELGDAFEQTTWVERASLGELCFRDLDGNLQSMAHPRYAGQARIVQLFGSWCPNCHDETAYLVELHRRYEERGLSIVGLAFELTGEFERDADQVRAFRERHDVPYPLFVVGTADKDEASLAFPAIDRLRSYPTTIFLHGDGRVRSVHSGFAGPATGEEHAHLRAEYEGLIEELLSEPPRFAQEGLWEALTASDWISTTTGDEELLFFEGEQGPRVRMGEGPGALKEVDLVGDAVWLGARDQDRTAPLPLRFDAEAGVLLDPNDVGRRYYPEGGTSTPLLERHGIVGRQAIQRALRSDDSLLRSEAIVAWTRQARGVAGFGVLEHLLADEQPRVRAAAIWAAGRLLARSARADLQALLEHPNGLLRREARRALERLDEAGG